MSPDSSSADRSRLLRTSLRANAAFSILSGASFALAGAPIADFLGIEPPLLVTSMGLNLLGFAVALLYVASRPALSKTLATIVIALDVGWVIGTAVLVYVGYFSTEGSVAAIAIANVVLGFAVVQSIGVRRLSSPIAHA